MRRAGRVPGDSDIVRLWRGAGAHRLKPQQFVGKSPEKPV